MKNEVDARAGSSTSISLPPLDRLTQSGGSTGLGSRKVQRVAASGSNRLLPLSDQTVRQPKPRKVVIIVDDVIEAVHGGVTEARGVLKPDQLESFRQDAQLLTHHPQQWFQGQTDMTSGVTQAAMGIGAGAAMLPFAIVTIRGGIKTLQETSKQSEMLVAEQVSTRDRLTALKSAAPEPHHPAPGVHALIDIETQSLARIGDALDTNSDNRAMAAGALASGTTAAVQAVPTIAAPIAALAVAKPATTAAAFVAATLPAVGTVLGIASTFVLGPLSAVFAILLGAFAAHSARRMHAGVQADQKLARQHLPERTERIAADYLVFIQRKFAARAQFGQRLKRWSGLYLGGAALFSLSIGAHAVLGAVALAGVAAVLATPIGLAVITAVGVASGIVMLAGSWQFIRPRGKHLRQQFFQSQQSRLLSRRLDSFHAASCLRDSAAGAAPFERTAALRANLFSFVRNRDHFRQHLLRQLADCHKRFRPREVRSGEHVDGEYLKHKPRDRLKDVVAAGNGAAAWLRTLVSTRSFEAARKAARKAHARGADTLSATHVGQWLNKSIDTTFDPDSEMEVFLPRMLAEQSRYLEEKLGLLGDKLQSGETALPGTTALHDLLTEVAEDRRQLAGLGLLLNSDPPPDVETLKRGVLKYQANMADVDSLAPETLNEHLAAYLVDDLRTEYTTTRGVLFDMERQALQIKERISREAQPVQPATNRIPSD